MTCALLVGAGTPAFAGTFSSDIGRSEIDTVPVVLDAIFMRPVGLLMTGLGIATFAVFAPIMLVTRPSNMNKPFNTLVVMPARFTFVDPLGYHPDRNRAAVKGKIL
ncbi:MAG: hypothetical protein V3T07_07015 [Myxococcota bacterium]